VKKIVWQGRQAGQHDFLCDMAPGWTLYQGGYGSGKTWAAARKFLAMHCMNQSPSMAVAPTYGDLWRFIVPELQRACDEWGKAISIKAYGSGEDRFCHAVINGAKIYLMSGDAPKRIAGFEVGLIWIDEGARVKEDGVNPTNDAPTQIRARLRHKRARVLAGMISTTPEGMETWIQRDFHDAPKADHRHYRGTTSGNDTLPASYVESLKASFGAELATQYLDGMAVNYARDRAHATFSKATHVRALAPNTSLPLHIGADFNVAPMCWVVCQQQGDVLCVLDEVVITDNAQVDRAVMGLKERGWGSQFAMILHPDRSSKSRSTTGDPEISVLKTTAKAIGLNMTGDAFGVNPAINSRINTLCRLIYDAAGKVRFAVDPRCKRVIDDLEKTSRGPNGYVPGPEGARGHILDALGYVAWDLYQPIAKAHVAHWRLG
jgi:hypothetical protein